MRNTIASSFIAAAALCGAASTGRAQVIDITAPGTTLSQAIGHQFVVGNHLFTLAPDAFSSNLFNPAEVFITPVINADPLTGAGFRLTGAFGDPNGTGPTNFSLHYTVDMLPAAIASGLRFDRADLRFNGHSTGAGSIATLTENIAGASEGNLGSLNVHNNNDVNPVYDAGLVFANNNLTHLIVDDSGSFDSGASGTSSGSFMDFSFGDRSVPAPGVLALLGIGTLVTTRRRR